MALALVPLFLAFYFYFHRTILGLNKSIFLSAISLITSLFMYVFMDEIGAVKESSFEIILRFIELITGVNQVVLNVHNAGNAQGASFVEILAHVYQFLIVMYVYAYIIKRKGRVNLLLVPIVCTCILMSILYGSFLGFFVARTKLIILWLLIVFLALSENRKNSVRV